MPPANGPGRGPMCEPGCASVPGLVIAAARSGAGKTTIALGLMRALTRAGITVQSFKCGPDYIDPGHHEVATRRPSFNLDSWAMSGSLIDRLARSAVDGAQLAITEGAMGLFDGAAGPGQAGTGATGDIAARLGWPVVLVLDVSGQTETAAAIALGCSRYRAGVQVAGVILNQVASARHAALISPALQRIGMPLLGALARDTKLALPHRHLGLVQAVEIDRLDAHLDGLADTISRSVDLDAVRQLARPAARISSAMPPDEVRIDPPGQRVAVAQDRAFSFLYPHILRQWRAAGAEIVPFSPLADEPPERAADAVWLPGGYPELHAGTLATAQRFKSGLRALAARAVPVHGECGGFMVLGEVLEDADGTSHQMAGLLRLTTSFAHRRLHLGYRRARLLADCALGSAGRVLAGHEFHYASIVAHGGEPLAACTDAAGDIVAEQGLVLGSVSGTFFHAIDRIGD